jgi:hypothetical protein
VVGGVRPDVGFEGPAGGALVHDVKFGAVRVLANLGAAPAVLSAVTSVTSSRLS